MTCTYVCYATYKTYFGTMERNIRAYTDVGSTGSFILSPLTQVYSATKAYIMSFSNALYGEYRHTGIKITLLCPGTETEFARKAI